MKRQYSDLTLGRAYVVQAMPSDNKSRRGSKLVMSRNWTRPPGSRSFCASSSGSDSDSDSE